MEKHACRLAADGSFAKAREHLAEMLDVRLSVETIRTRVEARGKAMAKFQTKDDATAAAFAAVPGDVEFAVDAGKVNTREEGWKDLKIAVISKRRPGEPATPDEWNTRTLPVAGMVLAFAMIGSAKTFRRTWRSRLRALGVTAFSEVHVLGDGAGWIWNSATKALTGCLQTLDVYHACEHLAKAAKKIFGDGSTEATAAYERGRTLLLARGWAGVCDWVGDLLAVPDDAERERRRVISDRTLGYFVKHVGRIDYATRLASGQAIGSGVVEGQAKTLGLRLKSRGARWNLANVRPMASLVCVRHSAQWEAYWTQAA